MNNTVGVEPLMGKFKIIASPEKVVSQHGQTSCPAYGCSIHYYADNLFHAQDIYQTVTEGGIDIHICLANAHVYNGEVSIPQGPLIMILVSCNGSFCQDIRMWDAGMSRTVFPDSSSDSVSLVAELLCIGYLHSWEAQRMLVLLYFERGMRHISSNFRCTASMRDAIAVTNLEEAFYDCKLSCSDRAPTLSPALTSSNFSRTMSSVALVTVNVVS